MQEKKQNFQKDSDLATAADRLLASEGFKKSPSATKLLSYLVKEQIAGDMKITPYHIASAVLNIDHDFDAHSDSIVRVRFSRLRNLIAEYYDGEGRDDSFCISIPKGQYNLVLESGAHGNSRFGLRIAVLPFQNSLPNNDEDADISDGLTQEIINTLSMSNELRLIAPDTVFQLRKNISDPVAVGRILNVDYVINGSISITSTIVKVLLKLTDVSEGQLSWSSTYRIDKSKESIDTVLEDCARRITGVLFGPGGTIDRLSRGKPQRFSSFSAVLKHYRHIETYTPVSHKEARDALEQAVKDSPDYAEAWACLGGIYCNEYMFGFNFDENAPSPLDRALFASKRSVQLSPDCVMGQYGLALAHYYRREYELFRDAAEHAIKLAPYRADLNASLGMHLAYDGDWERGLQMLDLARSINPLHPSWYWYPYAADACRRHDFTLALIYCGRLHMPDFYWDHLFMATMLGHLGRIEKANESLLRSIKLNPEIRSSAREVIGKIIHDKLLIDMFIEGLGKAGLETC